MQYSKKKKIKFDSGCAFTLKKKFPRHVLEIEHKYNIYTTCMLMVKQRRIVSKF